MVHEIIRGLNLTTLEKLDEIISSKESELTKLKEHRRKLFVDSCEHYIVDESYTNGHSGNLEERYRCNKCNTSFDNPFG